MVEIVTAAELWWTVLILTAGLLIWFGAGLWGWVVAGLPVLIAFTAVSDASPLTIILVWLAVVAACAVLGVPAVRRRLLSGPVMEWMRHRLPPISATERQALEAGGTGWEKQLFSGLPRWRKLRRDPGPRLEKKEMDFLEGPVEWFCGMVNDYQLNHLHKDLSPEAWELLRKERFFGMTIPEKYGGLGFSPSAHSAVILKIASRSISAALTVMIPNSVGPAKLILEHGTEEQKKTYLPALAAGDEIPCFALTGPEAGSDAASIPDHGVVCRGEWQGRTDVLGVRISFDKRYISLAPIATLLGVAFKLSDPDGLLGGDEKRGITLALVPSEAPGVERGARHDPGHMGFHNGPIRGTDVFVPVENIIGGVEGVGRGWPMLMECLTDGRAISLPALSCAAAKTATRVVGAYSRIRYQFHTPIVGFEGVREALAAIAGNTLAMEAARQLIISELDAGRQPAVAASIVKYNLTDRCRRVMDLAMDLTAGAGLMLGPRNLVGEFHKFPPLGVTVEGANILTRSLITFGQGVIRCHPTLCREMEAISLAPDPGRRAFDRAFAVHLRHLARNALRSFVHGLTGARLAAAPARSLDRRSYRQIARLSAAFALTCDVLLLTLENSLKRHERISARMADVLSQMYIASGVLRLLDQLGRDDSMNDLKDWAVADCLWTAQAALEEVCNNMPARFVGRLLRFLIFPLGRPWRRPSDGLENRLAQVVSVASSGRDRLTAGIYLPMDPAEPLSRLETALRKVTNTSPLADRLREGERMRLVTEGPLDERIASAVAARLLSSTEAEDLLAAERARLEALRVDEFESATFGTGKPV